MSENISIGIIIFFFSSSIMLFLFGGYFIYVSKIRFDKIPKAIKNEIRSYVKINAIFTVNKYNFEDVVNGLDLLIVHFNKTNKRINIATSLITFIAGLGSLVSAIIILITIINP